MNNMKRLVKRTPVARDIARSAMRWMAKRGARDFNSADYWESRYREGRNSGAGSYNRLSLFKAEVINRFVDEHNLQSVIEFGCGDGSQLRLANYSSYIGVDVAPTVLAVTSEAFASDPSKRFVHLNDVGPDHRSDLSMSLDVIYHLVEDSVFNRYMSLLFQAGRQFVIVYSSNEERPSDSVHVRHRRFTDWVERNCPDFRQVGFVKNAYPEDVRNIDNTSFADFYFFRRDPEASQA